MSGGTKPAYPHLAQAPDSYEAVQHPGLTKRELFAMAAMQGLLARHGDDDYLPDAIARFAKQHADALLAALAEPPA